jgi:hypothetical protein
VTLSLWGVPVHRVPPAIARMALDRRHLRRVPGLRFAKLLGTGSGRTFTARDADPRHWGLLAAWDCPGAAAAFDASSAARAWARLADERLLVSMVPLASRGRWSGRAPFGDPAPRRWDGPVAAVTRARIRPRRALPFWRTVPPVAADLHGSTGLRFALGIGEAPLGVQGTFSIWETGEDLSAFAYHRAPHAEAVRRTAEVGWYAEELFARLAVADVTGTYDGRAV